MFNALHVVNNSKCICFLLYILFIFFAFVYLYGTILSYLNQCDKWVKS